MSLVEPRIDASNLNVRVYKRSQKRLVLLWSKLPEVLDPSAVRITAKSLDPSKEDLDEHGKVRTIFVRELVINPSVEAIGDNFQPSETTIICVINEVKNNLDPEKNYYLTIEYPEQRIRQGLKVVRAGVYPQHEKEDKDKNIHNFLWDGKSQAWRKQEGIMVDGKFFPGMVIVPCPSCGFNGVEKQ